MTRDKLLPRAQLETVVKALYASAGDIYWRQLGPQDRSEQYDRWVEDSEIGGVLCRYMTPEAARSWIKDGPMKEYARSLRGEGRYADFGRQGGTSAQEIVEHAFGAGAQLVENSRAVKPSRCLASTAEGTSLLVWGDATNFKNLLWSALRFSEELQVAAKIVILELPESQTDRQTSTFFQSLSARCGVQLAFMAERPAR